MPMTSQLSLTPTISPRRDISDWPPHPGAACRLPSSRSPTASPPPLWGAMGAGLPRAAPSFPTPPPPWRPNSSLAHCCLPTLASGEIFQYSHLIQALTSSEAPHCPQDEFWILLIIFYLLAIHVACGILVSGPGIEHVLSSLAARSLNYWTAREDLNSGFLYPTFDVLKVSVVPSAQTLFPVIP